MGQMSHGIPHVWIDLSNSRDDHVPWVFGVEKGSGSGAESISRSHYGTNESWDIPCLDRLVQSS